MMGQPGCGMWRAESRRPCHIDARNRCNCKANSDAILLQFPRVHHNASRCMTDANRIFGHLPLHNA